LPVHLCIGATRFRCSFPPALLMFQSRFIILFLSGFSGGRRSYLGFFFPLPPPFSPITGLGSAFRVYALFGTTPPPERTDWHALSFVSFLPFSRKHPPPLFLFPCVPPPPLSPLGRRKNPESSFSLLGMSAVPLAF